MVVAVLELVNDMEEDVVEVGVTLVLTVVGVPEEDNP